MPSDFQKLSDKIAQLADLTQQLRRENAELRLRTAALAADNTEMSGKIKLAGQRIVALMEKYPAPTIDEEAS